MATRQLPFSTQEYYHIYNRGTEKREIFLDDEDRQRFVKLLFVGNGTNPFVFRDFPIGLPYVKFERGESLVDIGAYCLMPNHFHILIRAKEPLGVSQFMNKILTSYSLYFNKKYGRTGRLFEGTFKAQYVDTDEYLKYLFAYIHLNPIKLIDPTWKENGIRNREDAEKYLFDYRYSSHLDYLGQSRTANAIINRASFPEYFQGQGSFESFIQDWLVYTRTT